MQPPFLDRGNRSTLRVQSPFRMILPFLSIPLDNDKHKQKEMHHHLCGCSGIPPNQSQLQPKGTTCTLTIENISIFVSVGISNFF